jgi:phage-related minor tail protein
MVMSQKDDQNLFRIKEILFGEELSELDQKLASLRSDFEQLTETNKVEFQKKFDDLLDKLQKNEQTYLEKLQAQEKYFTELHQQMKDEMRQQIENLQQTMLSKKDTLAMLEYLSNKIKVEDD